VRDHDEGELLEARRALESMLRKSEKALAKLAEGSWQHRLTQNNIHGLAVVLSLLAGREAVGDIGQAREALADMLRRVEKAKATLADGTPQATLAVRRVAALRIGLELVEARLAAASA
jgi:hypothetical protein